MPIRRFALTRQVNADDSKPFAQRPQPAELPKQHQNPILEERRTCASNWSRRDHATVHIQRLAGDVARFCGSKEHVGGRQFCGLA